jgi:hypothetical protein
MFSVAGASLASTASRRSISDRTGRPLARISRCLVNTSWGASGSPYVHPNRDGERCESAEAGSGREHHFEFALPTNSGEPRYGQ